MILLEDYLLWTLALNKASKDITLIPRMVANLRLQGHAFTTENVDKEILDACLYEKIAEIADQGPCPLSTLPLVIDLIKKILNSEKLMPDYCFIAARALIVKYKINILQLFNPIFCNSNAFELEWILNRNSHTIVVNLAKLIVTGIDESFFDTYPKKNHLFNLIVKRSVFGLYTGSAEEFACINAAAIISQFAGFQVKMPSSWQQAERMFEKLLQRGFPLHLFNNFPINFLKYYWTKRNHLGQADIFFDITLLNAGRTPNDLGIACTASNNKLQEIASIYCYDALLAIFNLINIHGYILPDNIIHMYLANILKMHDTEELPQPDLYLLTCILLQGVKNENIELLPSTEQAADLYSQGISLYGDPMAKANLGMLHQYDSLNSASSEYIAAENNNKAVRPAFNY